MTDKLLTFFKAIDAAQPLQARTTKTNKKTIVHE